MINRSHPKRVKNNCDVLPQEGSILSISFIILCKTRSRFMYDIEYKPCPRDSCSVNNSLFFARFSGTGRSKSKSEKLERY